MSAVSYTTGLYRLKIWSKPIARMWPRKMIAMIATVLEMLGSVMYHAIWRRLAPSTCAHSYSAGSMPAIAAR